MRSIKENYSLRMCLSLMDKLIQKRRLVLWQWFLREEIGETFLWRNKKHIWVVVFISEEERLVWRVVCLWMSHLLLLLVLLPKNRQSVVIRQKHVH